MTDKELSQEERIVELKKHQEIERKYFLNTLEEQERSMQIQTQNWYQSWKISYLEKRMAELDPTFSPETFYSGLDGDDLRKSESHISEYQKNKIKREIKKRAKHGTD